MNLNAYDNVKLKINKQKTWIDIDKQQLLSREIKFRPYITLSKRFNVQNKSYEYFLILLDDVVEDRYCFKTKKDDYGRIKINLKSIWNDSFLNYYNTNINIEIKLIEHDVDGDIYQLMI